MCTRVSYNCRIFLNMLHQVLVQLESFLTNSVNNNLIELVFRRLWSTWQDFLIVWTITFLKGQIPVWALSLRQRTHTPSLRSQPWFHQLIKGALIYWGRWSLKLPLLVFQLAKDSLSSRNSSLPLGQKISPRLVSSIARTVSKQTSFSLWICQKHIAVSLFPQ